MSRTCEQYIWAGTCEKGHVSSTYEQRYIRQDMGAGTCDQGNVSSTYEQRYVSSIWEQGHVNRGIWARYKQGHVSRDMWVVHMSRDTWAIYVNKTCKQGAYVQDIWARFKALSWMQWSIYGFSFTVNACLHRLWTVYTVSKLMECSRNRLTTANLTSLSEAPIVFYLFLTQ